MKIWNSSTEIDMNQFKYFHVKTTEVSVWKFTSANANNCIEQDSIYVLFIFIW